ncbi:MAG: hypothetical protein CML20_10160 [Rheinheimera sp.]|nr:hypothetical protein [Rheinheimera sp.]
MQHGWLQCVPATGLSGMYSLADCLSECWGERNSQQPNAVKPVARQCDKRESVSYRLRCVGRHKASRMLNSQQTCKRTPDGAAGVSEPAAADLLKKKSPLVQSGPVINLRKVSQ